MRTRELTTEDKTAAEKIKVTINAYLYSIKKAFFKSDSSLFCALLDLGHQIDNYLTSHTSSYSELLQYAVDGYNVRYQADITSLQNCWCILEDQRSLTSIFWIDGKGNIYQISNSVEELEYKLYKVDVSLFNKNFGAFVFRDGLIPLPTKDNFHDS